MIIFFHRNRSNQGSKGIKEGRFVTHVWIHSLSNIPTCFHSSIHILTYDNKHTKESFYTISVVLHELWLQLMHILEWIKMAKFGSKVRILLFMLIPFSLACNLTGFLFPPHRRKSGAWGWRQ